MTPTSEETAPGRDGTSKFLSDGKSRIACGCACRYAETRAVFANLDALHRSLLEEAGPADLPVRVMAIGFEGTPGEPPPGSWPLPWSPMEVAVGPAADTTAASGRLIADPGEIASLRALRATAVSPNFRRFVLVQTTDGQLFEIYPRDEAPANLAAALKATETPR